MMRQLEGASVDLDTVRHVHRLVVNEYWVENTLYYETLRGSIDLSGEFEAKDIKYIRDHFWNDDRRDGVGLRAWIYSFSASDPTARQYSPDRDEFQAGQHQAVAQPYACTAKPAPYRPASVLGSD